MDRLGMILSIVFALLCGIPDARAGQVVFTKDYAYQASEADSKLSCRAIAVEQVKRLLLEQVGTFVQSETVVKDFQLSKDQVVSMTAGIVSLDILSEQWDGQRYTLTARVSVDPKQVAEALDNLRGNAVDRAELDQARKQNDASLREIERLRTELAALKQRTTTTADLPEKQTESATAAAGIAKNTLLQEKQAEYTKTVAGIAMNNLLDKGIALLEAGENEKAFQVFDEAVRTYPSEKRAYVGRGSANARSGRTEEALRDFDKALELDPKFAKPYVGRGNVFRRLGKTDEAIKAFNKAIELNRDFAEAYFARGKTYLKMRERDRGMHDLELSASLGYKKAREALAERGRI